MLGCCKRLADLLLAVEARIEHHIAFELNVGNLQRDGLAGVGVDRFEDRSHAAARDHSGRLVLIEALTDADLAHVILA